MEAASVLWPRGSSKDASRRRRGCDADIQWRQVAASGTAMPQLPKGKAIPRAACVRPYALEVREGIVFIWCADGLPTKDPPASPDDLDANAGDFDVYDFVVELPYDHSYVRRADIPPMNRGDAAAATWIVRGDEDSADELPATPRPRRGYSLVARRGAASGSSAETSCGRGNGEIRSRLAPSGTSSKTWPIRRTFRYRTTGRRAAASAKTRRRT